MSVYQDKKRNTWYFRIRKKNIHGELKEITRRGFKTRREALSEEARELLKPLENKSEMSLNELWGKYIEYKKGKVREATIYTMQNRYKTHIKDILGNKKVNSISLNEYMDFQKHLIKKGLKIGYVNNIHTEISTCLKFGQKFFEVHRNIANLVGQIADNEVKESKNIWTPKDYEKFMRYCIENLNPNDYLLRKVIVMIMSEYILGFRVGEAQALTYNDIDFKNGILSIRRSYSPKSKKETLPKNRNSIRQIFLPKGLLNIYKQLYEEDKKLGGFNLNWYVFCGIIRMSRTTLMRYRIDLCTKAEVPIITNHELRHSQASYLTNSGVNRQAIAEMLGHSPEILLTTYSHTFQQANKELSKKQDKLFIPERL
jgi:integrase